MESTEERVMRSICAATSIVSVTAGSAVTCSFFANGMSANTVESDGK